MSNKIHIKPYTGALGAEILGIDLSKKLSKNHFNLITNTLNEYHVVFFRKQDINPSQLVKFGQNFGALEEHPLIPTLKDFPEIMPVRSTSNAGESMDTVSGTDGSLSKSSGDANSPGNSEGTSTLGEQQQICTDQGNNSNVGSVEDKLERANAIRVLLSGTLVKKKGEVYDIEKASLSELRIIKFYEAQGYFDTVVEHTTEVLNGSSIKVSFLIFIVLKV